MFITSNYINHKVKDVNEKAISPILESKLNLDLKNEDREFKSSLVSSDTRPIQDEINIIDSKRKQLPPTYNFQGKLNMRLVKRL